MEAIKKQASSIKDMLHINGNTQASEYSATATYAVGDMVRYNQKLYKCTTAIETPEDFSEGNWTETTLASEVNAVKSQVTDVETALNGLSFGIDEESGVLTVTY